MPRVIHFEIHAEQLERAVRFYESVFGWTFNKWPGPMDYWLIKTGDEGERGIDGGLVRRMGESPGAMQAVNAYVCTIGVASVDEFIAKSNAAGGVVALPKMAIPTIGWLAYCKDTEGNIFGLMQADPDAK